MSDLSSQIDQAANDPQSVSVDGQSVSARPIADLVQADQYLAARAARKLARRGIYFTKLLPAGAMSDQGGTRQGQRFDGGLS